MTSVFWIQSVLFNFFAKSSNAWQFALLLLCFLFILSSPLPRHSILLIVSRGKVVWDSLRDSECPHRMQSSVLSQWPFEVWIWKFSSSCHCFSFCDFVHLELVRWFRSAGRLCWPYCSCFQVRLELSTRHIVTRTWQLQRRGSWMGYHLLFQQPQGLWMGWQQECLERSTRENLPLRQLWWKWRRKVGRP